MVVAEIKSVNWGGLLRGAAGKVMVLSMGDASRGGGGSVEYTAPFTLLRIRLSSLGVVAMARLEKSSHSRRLFFSIYKKIVNTFFHYSLTHALFLKHCFS